jgi:hypothetical protein
MVWLLSFLLCFLLLGGMLLVIMPELFPRFIAQRWERHFHYFRH